MNTKTPDTNLESMQANALKASQLLKSMSHPVRLMVLCALVETELNVTQLLAFSQVSQSVLSQHLAVLRKEKLVITRRESQVIYYRLSNDHSLQIIQVLHNIFCE